LQHHTLFVIVVTLQSSMSRDEVPNKGEAAPAPLAESPRGAAVFRLYCTSSTPILPAKGGQGGQAGAVQDNTECHQ
jgi:hypothetical protein